MAEAASAVTEAAAVALAAEAADEAASVVEAVAEAASTVEAVAADEAVVPPEGESSIPYTSVMIKGADLLSVVPGPAVLFPPRATRSPSTKLLACDIHLKTKARAYQATI